MDNVKKWVVVRDADKRKPIEVRTADVVHPGAVTGALIAKVENSLDGNRNAVKIATLPEIIATLADLVRTEEEYGDLNNAAVNESWLRARTLLDRLNG